MSSQKTLTRYCPRCLQHKKTYALHKTVLDWRCSQCLSIFPIIDNTSIILLDFAAWFAQQGDMILLRKDLSAEQYNFFLQYPGPLRDTQKHLYRYLHAPKSPLHKWLQHELESLDGNIVDLGCGIGLHDRKDIVGIDLNWTLLERYPGEKIIADIFALPFITQQMDAVLLINIFDSLSHPFALLQQADALLKKGGTILFASPFCWDDHITPIQEQQNDAWVKEFFVRANYQLVEDQHDWFVQLTPNSYTTHRCHTIRATKK